MGPTTLAIDVGGTGLKASVLDADGHRSATGSEPRRRTPAHREFSFVRLEHV
jgi:sugar (pentulose or hexulose) kinase